MGAGVRIAVVEHVGSGGLVHYAYQLCEALTAAGAEVTLLTEKRYELEGLPHAFRLENRLSLSRRRAHVVDRRAGRLAQMAQRAVQRAERAGRLTLTWIQICRFLERERPDVVQMSIIHFPFERLFLRRLHRKGLVLTQICHEFEDRPRGGAALARIGRRLTDGCYPYFSAIFFHGTALRQRFRATISAPEERQHVIEHGNQELFLRHVAAGLSAADLRRRYGIGGDQPLVLFFGNINPSKGVEDLLHAAARLPERLDAQVVVAGYPSKDFDGAALTRLRDRLRLTDRVRLDLRYLALNEVGPLMEAADVAVFPYRSATASGAAQVAHAYGVPVVVTQVGTLSEVASNGSGLVVPPRAPSELAAAIARLLGDRALAEEMGERGRQLARSRFAWSRVADDIMAVYAEVTRGEAPRGRTGRR